MMKLIQRTSNWHRGQHENVAIWGYNNVVDKKQQQHV